MHAKLAEINNTVSEAKNTHDAMWLSLSKMNALKSAIETKVTVRKASPLNRPVVVLEQSALIS
jgi:hypothetical protein